MVEQFIHCFWGLCHTVVESHRGIVLISHQSGFLQACLHEFLHYFARVVLASLAATRDISLVHTLAQFAAVAILQERHHRGIVQGEHPFAVQSSLLCHFGRRGDEVLRKSSQVVLVVDDELEGICLGEHVLSEGELQHRDFLIELAQLLLLVGREVGTAAHKTLVGLFEEFLLLLVELLLRLVVIHILHSLEEGGVHRDVVAVL